MLYADLATCNLDTIVDYQQGPARDIDATRLVLHRMHVRTLKGRRYSLTLVNDALGVGIDPDFWPTTVQGWIDEGYRSDSMP